MAKIHCHSLVSGSSWDSFDEDSPDDDSEAMEVDENNTFCTNETTRLRREDMPLFGLCPAQEEVCLVICRECGRVIKASAFTRHCVLMHQKDPVTLSPEEGSPTVESLLQSGTKSSPGDTAIKIEKVELEDSTVKIEEVPLTVPRLNHSLTVPVKKIHPPIPNAAMKKSVSEKSSSNRKSPRKIVPTREREFDADKHCGVWVQDQQKRCTRSLTCKTHALSLRRAVPGRRKAFDELLAEHKARVNSEKEQHNLAALKLQEAKAVADNNIIKPVTTVVAESPINAAAVRPLGAGRSISVEDDSSDGAHKTAEGDSDGVDDGITYSEINTLNHHPRPLATCPFGARKVGHGGLVFNRRQDHLRCAVLAMVEKCINPLQQRHSSGRPGVAAILHRPTVKTIAQSSNHGMAKGVSTIGDKYKSHGVFSSSNRNLNNFLKAPPPPRNKSVKQNSVAHGSHSNSADSSAVYQTLNISHGKKTFLDSSSSHLSSTGNEVTGFLKPDASSQAISDMGNIVASIDANVSGGQPLNLGQPLLGNLSRTSTNSFHTVVNVNLDSSLNLCSSLGLNSEVPVTGIRNCYTTINTPLVTTVSGNHINAVNSIQAGVGHVKDILPAPQTGKANMSSVGMAVASSMGNKVVQIAGQLDPNTGKVTTTSAGQRASPLFFTKQNTGTVQVSTSLPNGTGPSPPPNVTSVKGYPLSFVIQNSAVTKGGNACAAAFTKGHSLVFNNMPHVITQQPPMQQQKGKVAIRANSFQKGASKSSSPQIKIPQSPSPQQPSPGQLSPGQPPPQQKTIVVTSPQPGQQNLYLNHQHIPNSPQPIVQLKQQVEQQQQQLQQITLQQQLQQQQLQQQQQKQLNSQYVKQQLPIQPRLAPAPHPPSQTFITQQQLVNQNIVIKTPDQPLRSPPNSVFVTTDSHQNIQATVVHKPQSNVA